MLTVALGILLWSPSILGYGELLFRLPPLHPSGSPRPRLIYHAAAGFLLMTAIANLANFFLPLSRYFDFAIFLLGWGLFGGLNWASLLAAWRASPWRAALPRAQKRARSQSRPASLRPWGAAAGAVPWAITLLFSALLLAYVAYSASFSTNGDTGLYYLQTIRWLRESPVPLGLANLHGRLGYNSAWHSLAALLEMPRFIGKSSFLVNSTLMFLFGLSVLGAARSIWARRARLGDFFLALCALPLLSPSIFVYRYASSATANGSAMFVELLALAAFLDAAAADPPDFARSLWTSLMVSALALTIKISALPVLVLPLALLIWKRAALKAALFPGRASHPGPGPLSAPTSLAQLGPAIAALGLLFVPWLARGVALSGCLAYPIRSSCLPVEWRVAEPIRLNEELTIRSWARWPKQDPLMVLGSYDWLGPWLARYRTNLSLIVVLALIGLSLLVFGWLLWKRKLSLPGIQRAALLMPLTGLLYWAWSAPDIRFGEGYFWSLSLLLLAFSAAPLLAGLWAFLDRHSGLARAALPAAALTGLLALGLALVLFGSQVLPTPDQLLYTPPLGFQDITQRITLQGVAINTPTKTSKCWNADLPCTPYFSETLQIKFNAAGRPVEFSDPGRASN